MNVLRHRLSFSFGHQKQISYIQENAARVDLNVISGCFNFFARLSCFSSIISSC